MPRRPRLSMTLSFSFFDDRDEADEAPADEPREPRVTHCGHCGMRGHRIEGCHVLLRGARSADRADELAARIVRAGQPVGDSRHEVAAALRLILSGEGAAA